MFDLNTIEQKSQQDVFKSIKVFVRIALGVIFVIVAFSMFNLGNAIDDDSKSAIHQILAAVYFCCGFLSTICAILFIRK